jgi:hypothetical protein
MNVLKNIPIVLFVLCAVLMVSGCASKKAAEPTAEAAPILEAREMTGTVRTEVLDHKGAALGINLLPVWVQVYVEKGIPGVEALPDFDGFYCFVGEGTGDNLPSLTTWVTNYNISRDIAASVSNRVNALFIGSESGSPQNTYGSYYETVVTSSANAAYSGARKINDWWIRVRRYDPDSKRKYDDEYRAYVLYTIDKQILDKQVLSMMEQVASAATSDQQRAIDNVRAIMAREGL